MRKFLIFALLSAFLVGCSDKSIDRHQSAGSTYTIDYGKFILGLENTPVVLDETFVVRDELRVRLYARNGSPLNNIIAPAYFYVFRVHYCYSLDPKVCDVYVPLDIFSKFQPGDTIRWLGKEGE